MWLLTHSSRVAAQTEEFLSPSSRKLPPPPYPLTRRFILFTGNRQMRFCGMFGPDRRLFEEVPGVLLSIHVEPLEGEPRADQRITE